MACRRFAWGSRLAEMALAGTYLLGILAAICAIDARYGIIPDRLTAGLAAGGLLQTYLGGQAGPLERGFEAVAVMAAAALFRASYRWIRGFDGLGFGDVKLVGTSNNDDFVVGSSAAVA